jgi:biopolymer transport protein ExbD
MWMLMLLVALAGLGLAWIHGSTPRVVIVDLGPPNRIVVVDRLHTLATLQRLIRGADVERVVIRCPPEMPYDSLVRVVRAVEGAGVHQIHFATVKSGPPPSSRPAGP